MSINVEKARWHSLECLESGSVLLESKEGAYEPLQDCDILVKNGRYPFSENGDIRSLLSLQN